MDLHSILVEFKRHVLGDYISIATYIAAFFFSGLVVFLNLLIVSRIKYKKAEGTPEKWSLRFALLDNVIRITASMILIFLFYRFSGRFIAEKASMEWAVGIGVGLTFGIDKMMGWFKSKFDFFNNMPRTPQPPPNPPAQQ